MSDRARTVPALWRRPHTLALAAAALMLCAAAAPAAKIYIKGGATFTGTVLSKDDAKVVVQTASGKIVIPRDDLQGIDDSDSSGDPVPPRIALIPVAADKKMEALARTREAMEGEMWLTAGGLLEGLLALEGEAFGRSDRAAMASKLATCYLAVGDAASAARAFGRRAMVTDDEAEKRRVLAAAEALAKATAPRIGQRDVRTYEDALPVAVQWKADDLVAQARGIAEGLDSFGVLARIERAAQSAADRLDEADAYVPGTSGRHRRDVLGIFVNRIMDGARNAARTLDAERKWIDGHRWMSLSDKENVKVWTGRVMAYLALRQGAEDALTNLDPFAKKFELTGLYNTGEAKRLLEQMDDFKWFPGHRIKILPRRTGG
jgi:hypothetical protein